MNQKAIAIITGPLSHLDHIGVLAMLLEIPLIVDNHKNYELCREFYPAATVSLASPKDLSFQALSEYDLIFHSGKFWAIQLQPMIELLFGKKISSIYCPHGNSDKERFQTEYVTQDLSLVYGEHMLTLLRETGAIEKIKKTVTTGNYRFSYFQKEASFYRQKIEKLLSKKGTFAKKALFAPTWEKEAAISSFFLHTPALIESAPEDLLFIIKLHPFLAEFQPAKTEQLLQRYQGRKNVLFIDEIPIIYPLLEEVDLLIGDYSSVCYDFLALNRPLFFYNPRERKTPLSSCGREIPKEAENNPFPFILSHLPADQTVFAPARKWLYDHSFGPDLSWEERRSQLKKQLLRSPIR